MPANKASFFQDVYEVARLIPSGRVTSYGAIATYLGARGSARQVGWAMGSGAIPADVPAHRVVNSAGVLSGREHFGGSRMQNLLEAEGVRVQNNKIVGFAAVYWDPLKELG